MRNIVLAGCITRVVGVLWFWQTIRFRRRQVRLAVRQEIKSFPLGVGAWRTHMTGDLFGGWALCGQPVDHIGGPGKESTCKVCQKMARRIEAVRP